MSKIRAIDLGNVRRNEPRLNAHGKSPMDQTLLRVAGRTSMVTFGTPGGWGFFCMCESEYGGWKLLKEGDELIIVSDEEWVRRGN
jgi:hypothetical protein